MLLGLAAFAVLFWVYASSLQYAELALVTMGWVVMLQVGLVLVDRWRYGVELPVGKWVAIGVVLLAQAYLVLAPSASQAGATASGG
jgi:predicted ferric reductase